MYCTTCGLEISDRANYCRRCGASLDTMLGRTPTADGKAKGTSLAARMWRAAKLEAALYTEVASDTGANRQAFSVVAMAGLSWGLSVGLFALLGEETTFWLHTDVVWLSFTGSFFIFLVWVLIAWLLLALLAYWLGTKVFWRGKISATYGAILRATGFARVPSILLAITTWFNLNPHVGVGLSFVYFPVAIWGAVADVMALRQSLSLSTGQAIGLTAAVAAPLVLLFLVFLVV
jgi:hypothetical protein